MREKPQKGTYIGRISIDFGEGNAGLAVDAYPKSFGDCTAVEPSPLSLGGEVKQALHSVCVIFQI